MGPLERVADRQAELSVTANRLKSSVDRARWSVLLLSVAGSLSAAIAAAAPGLADLRIVLTALGAALLAMAAAIGGRYLSSEAVRRYIRARAASEALKREAYLYAAGAGAYADASAADSALADSLAEIDAGIAELSAYEVRASGKGSCPRAALTRDEYLVKRVQGQIDYYEDRADRYGRLAGRLHLLEWALALLAALITAAAGLLPKGNFDFAALTGVLTTVAGAILSHLEASRYDELVVSYRGAARRLEHVLARVGPGSTVSDIAAKAEAIVAAETGSWHGMFSR